MAGRMPNSSMLKHQSMGETVPLFNLCLNQNEKSNLANSAGCGVK
jgi:hypothetical protein